MVGPERKELGNNIFLRKGRWKRNQDFFLKATKISMKNEFGIVLDNSCDNKMFGLIRWDTNCQIYERFSQGNQI